MKLKTIIAGIALAANLTAVAQTADPVIMTINGKPVLRSEFEYSYNKNNSEGVIDKKNVQDYADLFINYKLKVEAALDAKKDTLTSYQKEFRQYRDQQLRPEFVSDADMEREVQKTYDEYKANIGDKGKLLATHIFVLMRQDADADAQAKAKQRIDSLYSVLQSGADFEDLAKRESQDASAKNGGKLPWIQPGSVIPDFEEQVYALAVGETSKPFKSAVGWHIAKVLDKKPCEPLDSLHDDILQFLERRGVRERVITENIDSLAKQYNITTDELMDRKAAEMAAKDMDLKYLIQEYHDGLLLYEVSNDRVWGAVSEDEAALEKFYKKNKKKYQKAWELQFRGMVYHVADQALVERVKAVAKATPFEKWGDVLKDEFNKDSVTVRVEKGYFRKGDSPIIDNAYFGGSDKEVKTNPKYPIDNYYGKLLKKPETYLDVKAQVTEDYQEQLMDEWVAELRKRYTFNVNQEVLNTVKSIVE